MRLRVEVDHGVSRLASVLGFGVPGLTAREVDRVGRSFLDILDVVLLCLVFDIKMKWALPSGTGFMILKEKLTEFSTVINAEVWPVPVFGPATKHQIHTSRARVLQSPP